MNMATCESIQALVDLLGTIELMAKAASTDEEDVLVEECTRAGIKAAKKDGLYFSGAHWYSRKNGKVRDSYTLKYQKDGTAHFCQTFAVMIHLGNENLPVEQRLVPEDYAKNIERAMDFWIGFLTSNDLIGKWIAKQMVPKTTFAKLKLALQDARGSAASLVSCKYGVD
jgi:hypothetical protein